MYLTALKETVLLSQGLIFMSTYFWLLGGAFFSHTHTVLVQKRKASERAEAQLCSARWYPLPSTEDLGYKDVMLG